MAFARRSRTLAYGICRPYRKRYRDLVLQLVTSDNLRRTRVCYQGHTHWSPKNPGTQRAIDQTSQIALSRGLIELSTFIGSLDRIMAIGAGYSEPESSQEIPDVHSNAGGVF
jgi:hypothetical protein